MHFFVVLLILVLIQSHSVLVGNITYFILFYLMRRKLVKMLTWAGTLTRTFNLARVNTQPIRPLKSLIPYTYRFMPRLWPIVKKNSSQFQSASMWFSMEFRKNHQVSEWKCIVCEVSLNFISSFHLELSIKFIFIFNISFFCSAYASQTFFKIRKQWAPYQWQKQLDADEKRSSDNENIMSPLNNAYFLFTRDTKENPDNLMYGKKKPVSGRDSKKIIQ